MSPRVNLALIVVVLAVIAARMSMFTVDMRDHALKFRIGEIVKADYEPGLHFKWPLVNDVKKFPNRVLTYEHQEEKFLTGEKKNLIVDYFVQWRIVDPSQYYRAVTGDETLAVERLNAIVKEGIKAAISQRTVQEVVSAERSELMAEMLKQARERTPALGIEIVDVRVKQIDLPSDVKEAVYERMRQERVRVAKQWRAEGEEQYTRIRADSERQRTVILSEAYRDAEKTRGAGDARAAEIYAQAFSKDRDFYAFYRSMQAYKASIGRDQDVLVLKPDSDFFQFLQKQVGGAAK
ncbi:MAG TPA: protease modulator HflC [Gammaproteobacteria bacterium]|nr:protease modulator HflC [Gammaproteobacteria bacterium]